MVAPAVRRLCPSALISSVEIQWPCAPLISTIQWRRAPASRNGEAEEIRLAVEIAGDDGLRRQRRRLLGCIVAGTASRAAATVAANRTR